MSKRAHHRLLLACLVLGSATATAAEDLAVEFRQKVALARTTTDQYGIEFTITGLSGIAWLGGPRYVAVMDNSDKLVALDIRLNCEGSLQSATVTGGITLDGYQDGEGLALDSFGRALVAEEGGQSIVQYDRRTGAWLGSLDLPEVFTLPGHTVPGLGLESLTLSADGVDLFTANEEALTVDGELSTPDTGTIVRIQHLGAELGLPDWQVAYETHPVHGIMIENARSGLVDLVSLADGRLLALERSFAFSFFGFWRNRIFVVDPSIGTDVSVGDLGQGLLGQEYDITPKTRLWASYSEVGNNLEGLCLGSRLPGGNHALLGVVDDDEPLSPNELVSFELSGEFGGEDELDLIDLAAPDTAHVGEEVMLSILDGPAFSPFSVYYSGNLAGFVYEDHAFDLGPPLKLLGRGTTDEEGAASWVTRTVPPAAAGKTFYLEIVAPFGCLYAESNPVAVHIDQ